MFSPKPNILYDDIIQQWWNYKIYTFTKSQGIDKRFISLVIYLHCDLHWFFFFFFFFSRSYTSARRAASLPRRRLREGLLALRDSKYASM